jgi:DNA-binding phage protein
MAENRSAVARAKVLSDVSLDLLRKKESILMSRTRVVRDLENAQNPRYRAVLSKALKDLDAQLSTLAAD